MSLPPVPKISVKAVERLRDKLLSDALHSRLNVPVNLDDLVAVLRSMLPAAIQYDTLFESVRYLAGQSLTPLLAAQLAWRLAGNLDRLKQGIAVTPWVSQSANEWVPLQVLRMVRGVNKKNKPGYDVSLRVLAGTSAGLLIRTFWSSAATKMVAFKVGFSRPSGSFPFRHATTLVSLRMFGLIESQRSATQPVFHEIACPDSLSKWNRDNILRMRLRVGVPCPQGYRHDCWRCAVGYEQCVAATHARTYEAGACTECGTVNAVFDPENQVDHCIECANRARSRRPESA